MIGKILLRRGTRPEARRWSPAALYIHAPAARDREAERAGARPGRKSRSCALRLVAQKMQRDPARMNAGIRWQRTEPLIRASPSTVGLSRSDRACWRHRYRR